MTEEIFKKLVKKLGSEKIVDEMLEIRVKDADGLIDREAAIHVLAREQGISIGTFHAKPLEFQNIGDLTEADVGAWKSFKVFVMDMFPERQFMQDGAPRTVRTVKVRDATGEIELTVWGDDTQKIAGFMHKPVILKSVQYQKNKFTRKTGEEVTEFRLSMGRYSDLIAVNQGQKTLAE